MRWNPLSLANYAGWVQIVQLMNKTVMKVFSQKIENSLKEMFSLIPENVATAGMLHCAYAVIVYFTQRILDTTNLNPHTKKKVKKHRCDIINYGKAQESLTLLFFKWLKDETVWEV